MDVPDYKQAEENAFERYNSAPERDLLVAGLSKDRLNREAFKAGFSAGQVFVLLEVMKEMAKLKEGKELN